MIENENFISQEKLEIIDWPKGIAFQPHGLDVDRDNNNLYAISHAHKEGGERIEVFHINTDSKNTPINLKYLHSITSEAINKAAYGALNSIAVTAPNKMYLTRFTKPIPPYGEAANKYLELFKTNFYKPTGVHYLEYDPKTKEIPVFRQVIDGFAMANGIALDLNKTHLWVADTFAKTVSKFEINKDNNDLIKHNEVWVGYAIDNLKFCEFSNRLYTAGFSSFWKLIGEINSPETARTEHPGLYSTIIEIGVPEYGMGI